MHYCFNILHVLCIVRAHFINGLNLKEETDNKASIISNEDVKHNAEHRWLTNNENMSDILAANTLKIHQWSKRNEYGGKIKQLKQDDIYFLPKFINKFVKNDTPPCNTEIYQEPNINKIMNRHNQILSDLIKDNVNTSEKRTVLGNYNANQNNQKYATENVLKDIHLKQNKNDATFETHYDSEEDKNLNNTLKERIKNRQPTYKGKNQLKCLTDLEKRIGNPLQENDVIKSVLNTQNFIAYLRKTLSNTYLGGKNPENIRNISETPKYIYRRCASMVSGSDKNHKKKKLHKPGVYVTNIKKEYSTKKLLDEYESVELMPMMNKVSKKPKFGDANSEANFECTVSCKFETTTEVLTTTTCEPSTTTCEPSTTTVETTTMCEPVTTCQVSETTCEESTTECKTTKTCEETTTECFRSTKKVTKKRKTTCSTKGTTCTPPADVEEEGDCEDESNEWPSTSKCETDQCEESEIINGDGMDE